MDMSHGANTQYSLYGRQYASRAGLCVLVGGRIPLLPWITSHLCTMMCVLVLKVNCLQFSIDSVMYIHARAHSRTHTYLFQILTSNNVWRRSLANVDVSWSNRCCSSRSFCHANSIRVRIPGIFVRPLLMIRSSSSCVNSRKQYIYCASRL